MKQKNHWVLSRICLIEGDPFYFAQESRFWTKLKQSVFNKRNLGTIPKSFGFVSKTISERLSFRFLTCTTLQRQNTGISKQIFPEKEYWGLSPNFHIHASVSDLYIPTISLPILLEEICRPFLGLYKSLTYAWMLKLGLCREGFVFLPCNN